MSYDGILRDDRCERCSRLIAVRTVSYFNEQTICLGCHGEERELLARLRSRGVDPATLAGCGYLPREEEPAVVPTPAAG
jgi:hypothetical protein